MSLQLEAFGIRAKENALFSVHFAKRELFTSRLKCLCRFVLTKVLTEEEQKFCNYAKVITIIEPFHSLCPLGPTLWSIKWSSRPYGASSTLRQFVRKVCTQARPLPCPALIHPPLSSAITLTEEIGAVVLGKTSNEKHRPTTKRGAALQLVCCTMMHLKRRTNGKTTNKTGRSTARKRKHNYCRKRWRVCGRCSNNLGSTTRWQEIL